MARLRDMAAAVVTATALVGCTSVIGDFTGGDPATSDAGSPDGTVPSLDATIPSDAGHDSADAAAAPVDATVSDAPLDAPHQESGTGDSGWDAPSAPDAPIDAPADAGADASAPSDAAPDGSAGDAGTDSSPDAPNPVDAGPDGFDATPPVDAGWFPTAVPGVVLWLEANSGVVVDAGRVVSWLDQSGNGNHANPLTPDGGPVLIDGGAQPFFLPDAANSLPAVHFDNRYGNPDAAVAYTCLRILDNRTLQFGTSDFLVAIVVRTFDVGNLTLAFDKQASSGGIGLFMNWDGRSGIAAGTTWVTQLATYGVNIPATPLDQVNLWTLYAVQRVGTLVTVRLNGAVSGALNLADAGYGEAGVVDLSSVGTDVTLGNQFCGGVNGSNFAARADLAEVVVVNGAMDAGTLGQLEGYLIGKYALP